MASEPLRAGIYVGSPAILHLELFGQLIYEVFEHHCYLVGSATRSKQWRDVDIRLILPDEQFMETFGSSVPAGANGRWATVNMAYSALAEKMTGLPVDFQIQPQAWANEHYKDGARMALGLRYDMRTKTYPPPTGDTTNGN